MRLRAVSEHLLGRVGYRQAARMLRLSRLLYSAALVCALSSIVVSRSAPLSYLLQIVLATEVL
eukprot:11600085-Alexandrium_andersonii.AAC.1